jgi:hypothetical protein
VARFTANSGKMSSIASPDSRQKQKLYSGFLSDKDLSSSFVVVDHQSRPSEVVVEESKQSIEAPKFSIANFGNTLFSKIQNIFTKEKGQSPVALDTTLNSQ